MYVELHARSAFSFLEGASLPETLAYTCAELQLPAMALLDRDGVYGAPRFYMAAKQHKIKAHVGAEISLEGAGSLPVLVESQVGYQNLCRFITTAKLRITKKDVATSTLEEFRDSTSGLVCLTGDEKGPLAHALAKHGIAGAKQVLQQLVSVFGRESVYVELQRHSDRFQESRNQTAISLAQEFQLPVVATNGVRYAVPADRAIADVFTCIKYKEKLETAGRLLSQNCQRYIRSEKEMANLFADIPEAIANTQELSSRLGFTLEKLGYEFPSYPVPEGETMDSFLYKRTWEGARSRYRPVTERVRSQLGKELALIKKLKLAGYFLIVWDLIRFCQQSGILVQGRGSAANSAVCYSLSITAVDPIALDLLFERFLSEERGEWPDIDLDLPSGDEREKVIQYVYERYGKRGAAMTANVCTYRGRSAAREVGKVLGFDEETQARLSNMLGTWEWRDPKDTPEKQFKNSGLDIRNSEIAWYMDLTQRIQNLPRHLSQHSGGMVICQGRLDSVVPLEPATMENRIVLQWDKDDCADLGLIKVDLLGLGMMAVLKDSIGLIREHYEEEVDLAHLPQNSPDVWDTICKADTIGMFQIESRAQMASLPLNKPQVFNDLTAQVAIIRPGPIQGGMTNPYLRRRQGKESVTYAHPLLIPILKQTLGVPLYQEQLLRMAKDCAGITPGQAEELRRSMGHKRSVERMQQMDSILIEGMIQNGIHAEARNTILSQIKSFALYGFPQSHAASFALLAYASAFLKVRYLAAFTAALLNNQPMGFYHPATLVKDAQRHGLRVKPIDVTRSDWNCSLENDGNQLVLRVGLSYVRGLQQAAAEALTQQRSFAPFFSVEDLARRVPELSQANLEMLARIGALNNLGDDRRLHRRDALWQVGLAKHKVGPLLEGIYETEGSSPLAPMSIEERLVSDYHGTGMTVGPHPMAYRREALRALGIVSSDQLKRLRDGSAATVAGHVIVRQRPGTAKGVIFLTLEDETGNSNVIVFHDFYDQNRMTIVRERFVRISGVVQNRDGVVHLIARSIGPLAVSAAEISSHDFY